MISQNVQQATAPSERVSYLAQRKMVGATAALENRMRLSSAQEVASPRVPIVTPVTPPQPLRVFAMKSLVLRAKPMSTSARVSTGSKGDDVTVKSKQGRWWLVNTSDGHEGWLFSSYLAQSKMKHRRCD